MTEQVNFKSFIAQAVILGLSGALLFSGCGRVPEPTQLATGEALYGLNCASCHYDGRATDTMPALIGSPALATPTQVARIILHGQRGTGIMPAQDYLTDEEIAAIVEYVRHEFAGKTERVSVEEIRGAR
jgi:mono/diheme cytochrome c family protein